MTAAIRNSIINADGGVLVSASDTSKITAIAVGLAIAVTIPPANGGSAGVAVGISAARNEITGHVRALVDDSTVTTLAVLPDAIRPVGETATAIAVRATTNATIEAYTIAGAAAVSGGQSAGGAGTGSGNYITNSSTSASVTGGSTLTAHVGDITVVASDRSAITAVAGALSLSLVLPLGGGARAPPVAVSIGVTVAVNQIAADVIADVDGSTLDAAGAVAVTATSVPTIYAVTLSGAFGLVLSQSQSFTINLCDRRRGRPQRHRQSRRGPGA